MKIIVYIPFLLLLFGCHGLNQLTDTTTAATQENDMGFHTNLARFHDELNKMNTIEERNKVIDEIIVASNMECNQYLYQISSGETKPQSENNIYSYMFDKMSRYIGLDIAKDAIDAVSVISDMGQQNSNVEKYDEALKPHIIKGVEIARKNFLKEIESHKNLDLKTYTPLQMKEDLSHYDKRCSSYYGVMEISKALEAQQTQPTTEAKSINVDEVTSKVKEVTKEVSQKAAAPLATDGEGEDQNITCTISIQDVNTTEE